ncbi:MAG: hypothetical protein IPN38_10545 [Flavobacteriales bacterium]|nr:hypothetical protein [Flavobacteriales bacterium]
MIGPIPENNVEYERYIKFVTHILDAFTTTFAPKEGCPGTRGPYRS